MKGSFGLHLVVLQFITVLKTRGKRALRDQITFLKRKVAVYGTTQEDRG